MRSKSGRRHERGRCAAAAPWLRHRNVRARSARSGLRADPLSAVVSPSPRATGRPRQHCETVLKGLEPRPAGRDSAFFAARRPECRSWDDFLVIAAQNWRRLRDELTSGRLGDFVRRVRRPDLLPRLEKARSADDQLDDWLGRLPTTRPSALELDVHPQSLLVRADGGGGLTQQTLRMTNIGYRLLRSTARVEPAARAGSACRRKATAARSQRSIKPTWRSSWTCRRHSRSRWKRPS